MPAKGQRKPRVCPCGETSPNNFYVTRASECKQCIIGRTAQRQRGNKSMHLARHLRRSYGITPEFYDAEFVKQNGLCAMCGLPPNETDLQKTLVVDHDHINGKFRGLIYGRCNAVLGYAQDRIEIVLAATSYLTRHN